MTRTRVELLKVIAESHRSMATLQCHTCGVVKHIDEYHKAVHTPSGRSIYCKKCRTRAVEELRFRSQYGIDYEDWARMYESQNKCCLGCRRYLSFDGHTHVDHDHISGKVRGLLCRKCNMVLGLVDDDTMTLRVLAFYLEKTEYLRYPQKGSEDYFDGVEDNLNDMDPADVP